MEHKVKCLGNDGLQGQQISAQGNTLGNSNRQICNTPCKGQKLYTFTFVLLPLQGEFPTSSYKPQGGALG